MLSPTARAARDQRGSITVTAVFFALVIAGVAVTMIEFGLASRRMQARGDSTMYALEVAEAGTALAELEIAAQTDPDGDGIGNLSGTYAGLRFTATATEDPTAPDHYTIDATGWHGPISRRIETGCKLVPVSPFAYGLFARDLVTLGSAGAATDAYDSRLGSWDSQAVNTDAAGQYAMSGGSLGSNGNITLNSQVTIRGDASPGPTGTTTMSSNATVTGDTAPMPEPIDIPPTPYSEFLAASLVNDNGKWQATGVVGYNALTSSLSVGNGTVVTLTGQTYFFHTISLTNGGALRVANGPVKIYVTDRASLSGGFVINETGQPINMQIYLHPYALPVGSLHTSNSVSITGHAKCACVVYAPTSAVTVAGNSSVCGSLVGRTVSVTGGSKIHWDVALARQLGKGVLVQRLFWRDSRPPLR